MFVFCAKKEAEMNSRVWLCLIFIAALTAGCAAPQSAAAPTSVPPTNTPAPTHTATITPTITPTATITPAPTPTNTATLQPIPQEFTLLPQWQAGETRRFQRITTRSDRYYGQAPETNSLIDTFTISVQEANEAGYVLEWKLEGMDEGALGEEAGADMDALFASMNEAIRGMRVKYEVDAWGQIVGLANLDEVRSDYETMQKTLLAGFENMGLDEETIDMMVTMWDLLFTDEMLEAYALDGPRNYHRFYGLDFDTMTPVTYLFSGEMLDETGTLSYEMEFEVVNYDPENNQVQMHGFAVLDGEQFEKFVQVYIDTILSPTMVAEMELDDESIAEITAMIQEMVYSIEVDLTAELSTGWITAHKMTTQIEMDAITRVETVNTRMLEE
jgi:hypothetical protein